MPAPPAVGRADTRGRLERFAAWRCGGTTSPGAGVRLTCVKDCSRIELLVLGLTIDGRPRGTPPRPKRCAR